MQAAAPASPDVIGTPDLNIRRGVGFGDDRTLISYEQYRAIMQQPDGPSRIRRMAVVMRAPLVNKRGQIEQAGGGEVVAMPAEKFQKWYGQHYRPTVSVEDHDLYEFPEPAPPTRWLPSMIEEAIAQGLPIPRELKPAGYAGPVFDLDAPTVPQNADLAIHRCDEPQCARFFDSAQGLALHKGKEHK